VLLAAQLPAAVLVDRARDELGQLLARMPELRTPAPGEDDEPGGEA
jgi:histidine ammonia-lyase